MAWPAIHFRRGALAQLMSIASSPGGTWPDFFAERQLPLLVGTLAAGVFHGSAGIAWI